MLLEAFRKNFLSGGFNLHALVRQDQVQLDFSTHQLGELSVG